MNKLLAGVSTAALLLVSTQAFAFGPVAVAGAQAIASQSQDQTQGQGQGQEQGQINRNSAKNGGNNNTSKDNSNALGVALGQFQTAATGQCAGGLKFAFGLVEYTHTLHDECLYQLSSDALRVGMPNTAAAFAEAAYNNPDTLDLTGAMLADVELASKTTVTETATVDSDQLRRIENNTNETNARLGAIKSSWENEDYGSPSHRKSPNRPR